MNPSILGITLFCTDWCPACIQLEGYFKLQGIKYTKINIEEDDAGMEKTKELNNGNEVIPTVLIKFQDGKEVSLSEPTWGDVGKIVLKKLQG